MARRFDEEHKKINQYKSPEEFEKEQLEDYEESYAQTLEELLNELYVQESKLVGLELANIKDKQLRVVQAIEERQRLEKVSKEMLRPTYTDFENEWSLMLMDIAEEVEEDEDIAEEDADYLEQIEPEQAAREQAEREQAEQEKAAQVAQEQATQAEQERVEQERAEQEKAAQAAREQEQAAQAAQEQEQKAPAGQSSLKGGISMRSQQDKEALELSSFKKTITDLLIKSVKYNKKDIEEARTLKDLSLVLDQVVLSILQQENLQRENAVVDVRQTNDWQVYSKHKECHRLQGLNSGKYDHGRQQELSTLERELRSARIHNNEVRAINEIQLEILGTIDERKQLKEAEGVQKAVRKRQEAAREQAAERKQQAQTAREQAAVRKQQAQIAPEQAVQPWWTRAWNEIQKLYDNLSGGQKVVLLLFIAASIIVAATGIGAAFAGVTWGAALAYVFAGGAAGAAVTAGGTSVAATSGLWVILTQSAIYLAAATVSFLAVLGVHKGLTPSDGGGKVKKAEKRDDDKASSPVLGSTHHDLSHLPPAAPAVVQEIAGSESRLPRDRSDLGGPSYAPRGEEPSSPPPSHRPRRPGGSGSDDES